MTKDKVKHDCNLPLQRKDTRIIEIRCKECGYKNKIVVKDEKWRYEN